MQLYGGVWGGDRNTESNFGGDPNNYADCLIGNKVIAQQILSGL